METSLKGTGLRQRKQEFALVQILTRKKIRNGRFLTRRPPGGRPAARAPVADF